MQGRTSHCKMNRQPGIFQPHFSRPMKLFDTKVIAVSNQKGGVGKTTSAVNIAAYLAVTETPTLLIDMDPQANATSGVGIEVGSYKKSIYDIIIGKAKMSEVIHTKNPMNQLFSL